jgi:hypothetical protein
MVSKIKVAPGRAASVPDRLLFPRKETQHILGGVSLRIIKEMEADGRLTPVRLNKRSATAQVFHRRSEVLALAQAADDAA